MESHLYRRKILDDAISKAKKIPTIGAKGIEYLERIAEICCDSAMVSRDKSRVYRYLQHLVHALESERNIGYMNRWVEQKNKIEQIREELMEIDKVCNDPAGAHDYYEKWLHELAAYDRLKQSIREIIE
jgi:hypothetical protein